MASKYRRKYFSRLGHVPDSTHVGPMGTAVITTTHIDGGGYMGQVTMAGKVVYQTKTPKGIALTLRRCARQAQKACGQIVITPKVAKKQWVSVPITICGRHTTTLQWR